MPVRMTVVSPKTRSAVLLAMATVLLNTRSLHAHEGPPFPILMDERSGDFIVSVWADPDIGEANFFVIVEMPDGSSPPDGLDVTMWTEPVSGRLDRTAYSTHRQKLRHVQFEAQPHFDQRDMWKVGFSIEGAGLESAAVSTEVESTPPGYGVWDLALYVFPFLLVGVLWVMAMVRKRTMTRVAMQTRTFEAIAKKRPHPVRPE